MCPLGLGECLQQKWLILIEQQSQINGKASELAGTTTAEQNRTGWAAPCPSFFMISY